MSNVDGDYSSCDKCLEFGEYQGRIVFPGTVASLRTDIPLSFNRMRIIILVYLHLQS